MRLVSGFRFRRRRKGPLVFRKNSRPAVIPLLVLFCALFLLIGSCRSKSGSGPSLGGEADSTAAAPSIYMSARLMPDRDDIEDRFKSFLPDSGIVPVEVLVRNGTESPIVIHTSHGLEAPEAFHGLTLETGGREYAPLTPIDVLAVLMGTSEPIRYRKPGIFDAVISIAVPPALFVYGEREISVGRYYRAIFNHSIYESTEGGAVRPIHLDPGEEAQGFLFFYLPMDANPYSMLEDGSVRFDSSLVDGYEITLRPSSPVTFDGLPGTEGWNDAVSCAESSPPAVSPDAAERHSILFALPKGGKLRGGGLLAGRVPEVMTGGDSAMVEISGVVSSSARFSGAAADGRYAACALDFKASSRVYLVDISGRPEPSREIDLRRKTERVFLTTHAILVATTDGRCRYISLDGFKERRNDKIGDDVRDLFLDGDALYVLEEEELSILSVSSDDPLRLLERRPLEKADRRFVGIAGDLVFMVHGSGDAGRDTLVTYERALIGESARMVLPASARFAQFLEDDLFVQLSDGTLLRIALGGTGRCMDPVIIAHLPFEAVLIETYGEGYRVLGSDGRLAEGDMVPPLLREYVATVGVELPAVTPARSR